jgi:hypothetical protein
VDQGSIAWELRKAYSVEAIREKTGETKCNGAFVDGMWVQDQIKSGIGEQKAFGFDDVSLFCFG